MNTKKNKTGNENSIIIIILAVLLVVVLAIVGVIVAKDNKGLATFDGGKVTKSEYEVYYLMFASYLQMYGYEDIPGQILQRAALDKMILADAKKAGVGLTDDNKAEIDEIFADQTYVDYFKNMGFNIDNLRDIYNNDYIIQNYIAKLGEEASDEDIRAYIESNLAEGETVDMNEYNSSHILFSFTKEDGTTMTDTEKAELKLKAEAVLTKAKAGEDFAALAKEYSDDTGTAADGGKFTFYMDGNVVPEYSSAVAKLKDGEICATLVESTYGYHIIKLDSKVENGRLKSKSERSAYAETLFTYDSLAEEKNLKVNEDLLKKFVLEIDPTAYDKATEDTTNQNLQTITVE